MKKQFNILIICLLGLLLHACQPAQQAESQALATDEMLVLATNEQQLYSNCITDAAKPESDEISSGLVAIRESNKQLIWKEIEGEPYILVSSWKDEVKYYKNDSLTGCYNTGNYPIWVTTAPELQTLCKNEEFGKSEGIELRLKQLLGLPPNAQKKYFVEFWVRPIDLFRPCPDAEVSDSACGLNFPETVSEEHRLWIEHLREVSYTNQQWDKNYPWTQLGYTYDWNPNNTDHIGLSEFVIGKGKSVVVNAVYTTAEYTGREL